MQITVFGASGKVGRQVVEQALGRGYKVVAFVHSQNPFEEQKNLQVVMGDINDSEAVKKALAGSEAAISALGSWGTKQKDILSKGMKTIIPSMESAEVWRLITLTGSGARWSKDKQSFWDKSSHLMLGLAAPKILKDGEDHLGQLDRSKLSWTCVRSPVMSGKNSVDYKLDYLPPSLLARIPRKAVAKSMVDQIKNASYFRQAPHIHKA